VYPYSKDVAKREGVKAAIPATFDVSWNIPQMLLANL
jgi:hypothetical protein